VVLAGVHIAPFSEIGTEATVLAMMQKSAEVARIREMEHADLVGLRSKSGGNIAFSPKKESEFVPARGFFTYQDRFSLETKAALHELMHPLGPDHNRSMRTPQPDECQNCCAYRDPQGRYATIMSVEPNPDNSYPRLLARLSEEGAIFQGLLVGDPSTNNALWAAYGAEQVSTYYPTQ
jgi:hypothetical protein